MAHTTPIWRELEPRVVLSDIRYVRDGMRTDVPAASSIARLEEVLQVLGSSGVQRVAVVDEEQHLLGLITDGDLLARFAEHSVGIWEVFVSKLPFSETGRRHREFIQKAHATTAEEIMTREVVSVRDDTPIDEVIRLMAEQRLKRVPVLDGSGRFLGMLSRSDILQAGTTEVNEI